MVAVIVTGTATATVTVTVTVTVTGILVGGAVEFGTALCRAVV